MQWNESMTEDIDITNLIGSGSTIVGKKNKSTQIPNSVTSSLPVSAAAMQTPPPPQQRQKSKVTSSPTARGVEGTNHRRSSNIVAARDTRIEMSSLSPTAVLSTPPPPKFRPPRWTSHNRSYRGTPADGSAGVAQDTYGEEGEFEDQENCDASTAFRREAQQGKIVGIVQKVILA